MAKVTSYITVETKQGTTASIGIYKTLLAAILLCNAIIHNNINNFTIIIIILL